MPDSAAAREIVDALDAAIERAVAEAGGSTEPVRPNHRVPLHWPPHPIAGEYHVLPNEWTETATLTLDDESFEVKIARNQYGVFGKCDALWCDAKGTSVPNMLAAMAQRCGPFLARGRAIAQCLGREGRYTGVLRDLTPAELVVLLYCPDRDIAHHARTEIELQARLAIFAPALIAILRDRRHPNRRSAQWCVLDLFEDLPSFCKTDELQQQAIDAIRDLIWDAPDDYARTIYKAGVVLGGHISTPPAAEALIACIEAPSRFGRRSAIHAVFHLAEWLPSSIPAIVAALDRAAAADPEPLLRDFAASMARDIRSGEMDHVPEPVLAGD
ncbi:MAG TPA: hypothetical protein PLH94_13775 [Fimbriimonadaceae bacterium]|nr:hypothetical protein [Fimbriimonadaceae bacterium]